MKRKIVEFLIIIFFYVLQVTFGRVIAIGGIKPNFLVILPVLFGFLNGRNEGMYVGFIAGIMYDLYFSGLFGVSALIFVYIGYFAGTFHHDFEENELLLPLAILLLGSFGHGFVSYVGYFLLHNRLDVGYFVSRFILPEVIYTACIMVVLYKPMIFINSKLYTRVKRRVNSFDKGNS